LDPTKHITPEIIAKMPRDVLKQYILVQSELNRRASRKAIGAYFADEGKFPRSLYIPHLKFFAAGAKWYERCFMSGNRVGKTIAGAYEVTLHMTGEYPDWWEGRRFERGVQVWAAGDTNQTVRDILQKTLLGAPEAIGTGMIPGDSIVGTPKKKAGSVPDAIESFHVKHKSGTISYCQFKSYDQKRRSFQGTAQDIIWLDEECPLDIYSECLMRTMTTQGLMMLTFTPLMGLTDVVLTFMPDGKFHKPEEIGKFIIQATWDDAPHLSREDKERLWSATPLHLREARAKGIPQLGSGAIYPIGEERLLIDPMQIPYWWKMAYALDVGWNATAALWGAWNPDDDTVYIWSEYKQGECMPPVHAEAINARGTWIPGVIDPAADGRNQKDGSRLMQEYQNLGLDIMKADNTVEAGILTVWNRMVTGRLKIMSNCVALLAEMRLYRRDEKGKIVKANDHLMDCLRYLIMTGLQRACVEPDYQCVDNSFATKAIGANSVTGY